jgi:hypothetical protein
VSSIEHCGGWTLVRQRADVPDTLYRWRCDCWPCTYCGPKKAGAWHVRVREGVIYRDRPPVFLTLTDKPGLPDDAAWRAVGPHWNRLMTRLARELPGGRPEYVRVLESTKAGRPHVHALVDAPYWPQSEWSDVAQDAGFGPVVWVTRAGRNGESASRYVTKYLTKALTDVLPPRVRRIQASQLWDAPWARPVHTEPDPDDTWTLVPLSPELVAWERVERRQAWTAGGPLRSELATIGLTC